MKTHYIPIPLTDKKAKINERTPLEQYLQQLWQLAKLTWKTPGKHPRQTLTHLHKPQHTHTHTHITILNIKTK